MTHIPSSDADPTADWFTGVLEEAGALRAGRVSEVRVEPIGVFSNRLTRAHLTYESPVGDAPATLVLKQPRSGAAVDVRQDLGPEIRFYRELAGSLPVRTPQLYFGGADPNSGRALLLMEDVAGLVDVDWGSGATAVHTEHALSALARLHASTRGVGDGRDWLRSFAESGYRRALAESYDASFARKRELFERLAPDFVDSGGALVGRVADALAPLAEPESLLHGDAHFENLALLDREPPEILFHDWAGVRLGSGWSDLATYLIMSYPRRQRRAVERELVLGYARSLDRAGGEVPEDPWLAYRYGALAWTVALVDFAREPEQDEIGFVIRRCARAALDLDVAELAG